MLIISTEPGLLTTYHCNSILDTCLKSCYSVAEYMLNNPTFSEKSLDVPQKKIEDLYTHINTDLDKALTEATLSFMLRPLAIRGRFALFVSYYEMIFNEKVFRTFIEDGVIHDYSDDVDRLNKLKEIAKSFSSEFFKDYGEINIFAEDIFLFALESLDESIIKESDILSPNKCQQFMREYHRVRESNMVAEYAPFTVPNHCYQDISKELNIDYGTME